MSPHGPDTEAFEDAMAMKLEPQFYDKGLAFMFETCYPLKLSRFARLGLLRQDNYQTCWDGLACNYDPDWLEKQEREGEKMPDNLLEWRSPKAKL